MTPATQPDRNPFATRHVRPGRIPFLFAADDDLPSLIDRVARAGWRGEIVGPHGSGKSTLLAALIPAIESLGRQVRLVTLHDGQRRLPGGWDCLFPAAGPAMIVVDGYQQLGRLHRWRLARLCRRRGWGLMVTAHRSVGLPPILETRATPELAQQIIAGLTQRQGRIDRDDVVASFTANGGNLREVLFDCYDLHRRRSAAEKNSRQD